ncbi:MAG: type II toxin-antitoxin system VapC family toxin [Spirochaetes bacterium]|nr:type II toxin-antitoxin system VapC family toxin [Spirochaetota bacterium]
MILVDTSVWIDHLRKGNEHLKSLLVSDEVLSHPFVVGELACGVLQKRSVILKLLQELPVALVADHEEVLRLLEKERLYGCGIGWVDAHLLASARLSGSRLWTLDTALSAAAAALNLS